MRKLIHSAVLGLAVSVSSALVSCKSCSTASTQEIERELIGHSTGGREKTWLFREGQIQSAKLIGADTWGLVVRSAGKEFKMRVRVVRGTTGEIESVGLLYIEQVN